MIGKEVGESLARSVATPELREALTDVGDVAIDKLVTSGALDGVPVLGLLTGLARAGSSIRDVLYFRKVQSFLNELGRCSSAEREAFVRNLRTEAKIERFGETVLLLLEKLDDSEKAQVLGRLIAASIEGKLEYDIALRTCVIVARCYGPDLDYLRSFEEGPQGRGKPVAESLFAAGVLSEGGFDGGQFDDPDSGGAIYRLNLYGEALKIHGLA